MNQQPLQESCLILKEYKSGEKKKIADTQEQQKEKYNRKPDSYRFLRSQTENLIA